MQLTRKWQQSQPSLAALAQAAADLEQVAQPGSLKGNKAKAAARDFVTEAAPAVSKVLAAARQLHARLAPQQQPSSDLPSSAEWDGAHFALPPEDGPEADDSSNGGQPSAEALAGACASAAQDMQGLFAAMQQAAADVASALQDQASRVRQAPASGALRAIPVASLVVLCLRVFASQFSGCGLAVGAGLSCCYHACNLRRDDAACPKNAAAF
jgi:hypothetical protein